MADTTIFALIGAFALTVTLVPVLCAWALRKGVRERRNPAFEAIRSLYVKGLDRCLARPWTTTLVSAVLLAASLLLVPGIGAEFMPHLDEGSLWVRANLPATISFEEAAKISPKVRAVLRSFPEVTVVGSELGRPDDGTDPTGFFNDEFFIGLKPYSEWKGEYHSKTALIEAINHKLEAFPGVVFNFTQPAEDAVDEAETGLKSALAVKIFGPDLRVLEERANQVKNVLQKVRGIAEVSVITQLGQPTLTVESRPRQDRPLRPQRVRHQWISRGRRGAPRQRRSFKAKNCSISSCACSRSIARAPRRSRTFWSRRRPDSRYPQGAGGHQGRERGVVHLSRRQLALHRRAVLGREARPRRRGPGCAEAGRRGGEASLRLSRRLGRRVRAVHGFAQAAADHPAAHPAADLHAALPALQQPEIPLITVLAVLMSGPIGGLLALAATGTPFSVSSGIGFLALFGVSVQTAVIYISYANELRKSGLGIAEATREAAILRLRPIMMTALVAALGLLPAALSTGIGSDAQRPFALVIVGGLISRLLISVFLMPALYALVARPTDALEV